MHVNGSTQVSYVDYIGFCNSYELMLHREIIHTLKRMNVFLCSLSCNIYMYACFLKRIDLPLSSCFWWFLIAYTLIAIWCLIEENSMYWVKACNNTFEILQCFYLLIDGGLYSGKKSFNWHAFYQKMVVFHYYCLCEMVFNHILERHCFLKRLNFF